MFDDGNAIYPRLPILIAIVWHCIPPSTHPNGTLDDNCGRIAISLHENTGRFLRTKTVDPLRYEGLFLPQRIRCRVRARTCSWSQSCRRDMPKSRFIAGSVMPSAGHLTFS